MIITLPLMSGNITNGATPKSNCNGSISIAYEDYEGNFETITLEGSRRKFPNIRNGFSVIKGSIISHIEIFGNCCWQIYSKRKFKGETRIIYPTEDFYYVDFQPVSIKRKIECF